MPGVTRRQWNLMDLAYPAGFVFVFRQEPILLVMLGVPMTLLAWLKQPLTIEYSEKTFIIRVLPLWIRGLELSPSDVVARGTSGLLRFKAKDGRRLPVFRQVVWLRHFLDDDPLILRDLRALGASVTDDD